MVDFPVPDGPVITIGRIPTILASMRAEMNMIKIDQRWEMKKASSMLKDWTFYNCVIHRRTKINAADEHISHIASKWNAHKKQIPEETTATSKILCAISVTRKFHSASKMINRGIKKTTNW